MMTLRRTKKPGFSEKTRFLAALAFILVALPSTTPAQAHGGGTPQLVQTPSGPYQLYAWTNPDPARIGTLHVTVALVEPATQQPVLNAAVQIVASPPDANGAVQPVSAAATHANAVIKTYYEADLELPAEGLWLVTVSHSDTAGSGSASFELDVRPATFNWRPIGIGAVLAVFAAGAWAVLKKQ